jgi:NADH-quinone oxidoreductase subunit C
MIVEEGTTKDNVKFYVVDKEHLVEELQKKKDEGWDYLVLMSGVDRKEYLEVVYHLSSYSKRGLVIIKARTKDEKLPSASKLWEAATWFEREIYDLVGVKFEGHPNLTRLFLPEGWVGHPLRKNYDMNKEQFVNMDDDGKDVVSFDSKDGW